MDYYSILFSANNYPDKLTLPPTPHTYKVVEQSWKGLLISDSFV